MRPHDEETAKRMCAGRISDASVSGGLDRHPMLVRLLYRWEAWGNEADVRSYVARLVEGKEGLCRFLVACVTEAYESTDADRVHHMRKFINFDTISEFIDIKHLEQQTRKMVLDPLPAEAVDGASEALGLFFDGLDRRRNNAELPNPL